MAVKGWLYIIEAPSAHRIKIGFTAQDSCASRLQTIQAFSPIPVTLAFAFKSKDVKRLEHHVHALLRDKRTHGEWFAVSVEEAKNAIAFAHENRMETPIKMPFKRRGPQRRRK